MQPVAVPEGRVGGEVLREQVRRRDVAQAEGTFAALCQGSTEEAFNHLLFEVQEAADVHRVVMPYRAWDLMNIIGQDHAHTLLRQSVRYCLQNETPNQVAAFRGVRELMPRLVDRHRLLISNHHPGWCDGRESTHDLGGIRCIGNQKYVVVVDEVRDEVIYDST